MSFKFANLAMKYPAGYVKPDINTSMYVCEFVCVCVFVCKNEATVCLYADNGATIWPHCKPFYHLTFVLVLLSVVAFSCSYFWLPLLFAFTLLKLLKRICLAQTVIRVVVE